MPECVECETIHGTVKCRVDGDVKTFCVHHERGERIHDDYRHRNPPKAYGVGTGKGMHFSE